MTNFDFFRRRIGGNTLSSGSVPNPGAPAKSVFVVGLGRFGTALAESLIDMDVSVMAIDTDQSLVDVWAERLTHVRLADGTNAATLEQLGVQEFDVAVVAIGTDIESSILTTAALADLGLTNIWAKAITNEHGRILERIGAHHVVQPERQMGQRVAHAVSGQVLDYFEVDEGFVLAEMKVPQELTGRSLAEAEIRQRFAVTVVCMQPAGQSFTYAEAQSVLNDGDILLVAGAVADVERFAEYASH